jgi:hypothetical protein
MVEVITWVEKHNIRVLNIAGPRESKHPGGIYLQAAIYLRQLFAAMREHA